MAGMKKRNGVFEKSSAAMIETTNTCETQTGRVRSISVEAWHGMALKGSDIPIRIGLQGDSMRPLIRREIDQVTIVPLKRPLRRGDIVLFADVLGRYVVHRVWKIHQDLVLTMGDHCVHPDLPMKKSQVWGLVVSVERNGRRIRLDCASARFLGRLWMNLLPVRRIYYRIRNTGRMGRK